MKKIILIGGGGHCRSVIDVIEQSDKFSVYGIVDKKEFFGSNVLGYSVVGDDSNLPELAKECAYAIITVGQINSSELRVKLFNQALRAGFTLPSIVSPRAYVANSVKIGAGSIIMHDALVNTGASIGSNCIINSKSLIEHDSTIENHCHISTNVVVNGSTLVCSKTFIGSGSVTKEGIVISKNSFIKAGSVVK
ncbi:MAG: NeuD/PglB/VioB family sugar acetyltransferase [Candidatus Thioglobus sp.]|jgi:sugar O-acyltransferase (sialic acid O-acetyltransferase NeuD family)